MNQNNNRRFINLLQRISERRPQTDSHFRGVQRQSVGYTDQPPVSAIHYPVLTLALGGALAGHAPHPLPALSAPRPPHVVSRALKLILLQLHNPLVGEDGGRHAAGQGGESLMLQDPAEFTVTLELVVLQPEALEPGQVLDHLLGQAGQVVGVESEGDQLGQS